jgi:protein transport protein SEC31
VSHSGAVNALDFNPMQQSLLASGGPSGELYIFNLADPKKPTVHQPGTSAQSPSTGAITSVAFHPRHRHILASSSQNGTTVIWDLREKRPAFSFSDPNRSFHCKSIAWHPEQPMHIAAASDDDECPLINIWDLHMTIAPNSTLKGHQRGVMSIAWCQADKTLMTSAGKDNRTLVWDVSSSSLVSEVGSSANWNLDVQWSPKLPTMMSTVSLEGKVRVYSISYF